MNAFRRNGPGAWRDRTHFDDPQMAGSSTVTVFEQMVSRADLSVMETDTILSVAAPSFEQSVDTDIIFPCAILQFLKKGLGKITPSTKSGGGCKSEFRS